MCDSSYLKFIRSFCNLSPYELKHFSEYLLCKIEAEFEEGLCSCSTNKPLTEKDLKFVLTETMQELMLELKQQEISLESLKLDETKARIFADRKVVA